MSERQKIKVQNSTRFRELRSSAGVGLSIANARTILMVNSKKKTRQPVWLRLRGYHVVTLKPDFDEHATGLERAIHQGIPAYPDMARPDFYDVALEEGWAYIHVYR